MKQDPRSGLAAFLMAALIWMTPTLSWASDWIEATISRTEGGKVYRQPNAQSEHLGTYPLGTKTKVYSSPQNGFYSIYLKQSWKNTHYIWISENDIRTAPNLRHPAAETESASNSKSRPPLEKSKTWWIEPRVGYLNTAFQEAYNGANTSFQMTAVTGGLSINWHPHPTPILLGADLSATLSPISQNSLGVQVNYIKGNVKGGLGFEFGSFELALLAGVCADSMSVSNNAFGYRPIILSGLYPMLKLQLSSSLTLVSEVNYFPDFNNRMSTIEFLWGLGIEIKTGTRQKVVGRLRSNTLAYGNATQGQLASTTQLFELGYAF